VSAGGVLLSLRSWSWHLFRGRPGHRPQLASGRRSSNIYMWHRKAWCAGVSSESLARLHVQTVSCDDGLRTIGSSTGPRPVREETSVFRTT